jgi:hypothetical protein
MRCLRCTSSRCKARTAPIGALLGGVADAIPTAVRALAGLQELNAARLERRWISDCRM